MNGVNYYSPNEIERVFFNASQHQNSIYVQFILLWASFNSRIARDSKEIRDTDMLRWVKEKDPRYRGRFQALMTDDIEFQTFFNRLRSIRVINFQEIKRQLKAEREDRQRKKQPTYKKINRTREFSSLIDMIYLVRCNLVHGSKNIEQSMELGLIELCYNIMLKLYREDVL